MAAQKSTLPPKSPEEQDSRYNPAEQLTEEKLNSGYVSSGIDQAEAFANDPENSTKAVKDAEESPELPGKDGFYRPSAGGKKQKVTFKGLVKKRGPLAAIIALILGGGGILSFFFAPGLGLVQLKEILTDDLNDQLAAFDVRSDAMWRSKLKGLQSSGVCSNVVKIHCQFRTMTQKQVDKFKAAGFTMETEETTFGRQRVVSMAAPNGAPINDPQDLINMRRDPSVRGALNRVYNPIYVSLSDSVATKVFNGRFKTSKMSKLQGTSTEELNKSMQESINGEDFSRSGAVLTSSDGREYVIDENGDPVYKDENPERFAQIVDEASKAAGDFDNKVSDSAAGTKAVSSVLGGAIKGASVLGVADAACTVYNTARAVAAAAKAERAIQLARYSMVFLGTADEIKAGTATAEKVAHLGNILTATDTREMITDELSATSGTTVEQAIDSAQARENPFFGKNAFDSPGYAVAAYNDAPVLTTRSQQYMVGGGLVGTLSSVNDSIAQALGGPEEVRETCNVIQSWWVRGAGLTLGVIAAIGSFGTSTIISIGASLAVSIALPFLEAALADIVAGNVVSPNTKGVDAGDATFAGTATLLGGMAQARGLKPLAKDELEPYLAKTQEVQNEYIAQARYEAQATPFDVMNQYSFLGSFARTLNIPYIEAQKGAAGTLSAIPDVLSKSLSTIIPSANAQIAFNPERFERCEDVSYEELGIAADVYCNVRYGLSGAEMAQDPEATLLYMLNNGHIDESGMPLSQDYIDFIDYCVERQDGWGETGEEQSSDKTTGKWCMEENEMMSNFRVYTIDKSVSDAMGEEEPSESVTESSSTISSPVSPGATITGPFGPRIPPCSTCSNWHQGVDFVSSDKAVFAIMDGVVENGGSGQNNIVTIRHADGMRSTYWHMAPSNVTVRTGDTVTSGQRIGLMGAQGQATGVHLHIEMDISGATNRAEYEKYRINTGGYNPGQRVDIVDFLTKNGITI